MFAREGRSRFIFIYFTPPRFNTRHRPQFPQFHAYCFPIRDLCSSNSRRYILGRNKVCHLNLCPKPIAWPLTTNKIHCYELEVYHLIKVNGMTIHTVTAVHYCQSYNVQTAVIVAEYPKLISQKIEVAEPDD